MLEIYIKPKLNVFTAVNIHIVASWVVTPYSSVGGYQHSGRIYCLNLLPWGWKQIYQTSVLNQRATIWADMTLYYSWEFDNTVNNVWCSYDNMLPLLISHNQFFTNRNVLFDKSKDSTSDLFTTMYNNGISRVLLPFIPLVQHRLFHRQPLWQSILYISSLFWNFNYTFLLSIC
jgi:hypothetical protein